MAPKSKSSVLHHFLSRWKRKAPLRTSKLSFIIIQRFPFGSHQSPVQELLTVKSVILKSYNYL